MLAGRIGLKLAGRLVTFAPTFNLFIRIEERIIYYSVATERRE